VSAQKLVGHFRLFFVKVRAMFKVPKRGSISKDENEARIKRDFAPLVCLMLGQFAKS
jgi:hypothetical protein